MASLAEWEKAATEIFAHPDFPTRFARMEPLVESGQREFYNIEKRRLTMAKILYIGTYGSDDPTRASFPFVFARGALEAGHQPTIALAGEAVYLLKEEVAAATQGVGWPTIAEQWKAVVEAKIPVYI